MSNLILTIVLKVFMSFVGIQLVEDTEVYLVDAEMYETKYEDMGYEEIISVDRYLDKEEEVEFLLEGYVYDNGDEFYAIGFDNNEFAFAICVDGNYDVLYYAISWY